MVYINIDIQMWLSYVNFKMEGFMSTREKVKNNLSIFEDVPLEVAEYIKQERLYYEED